MKVSPAVAGLVVSAAAAMALGGCVVRDQTTVYEERPRRVYVAEPAPPPPAVVYQGGPPPAPVPVYAPPPQVIVEPAPAQVVVIHRAPPPLRIERIPGRPGREAVWVPGFWSARGEEWVWVGGRWATPPHPGAVWVEPRYENHGTEVHFSLGFWR